MSTSIPHPGDGLTPQTAVYSLVLERDPTIEWQYVIHRRGEAHSWVRTTLAEARMYADAGYDVVDGTDYHPVTEWAVPLPSAGQPSECAFRAYEEEVDRAEEMLSSEANALYEDREDGEVRKGDEIKSLKSSHL
ncbi:hypothetical protein K505DRAFT_332089 [Melanomma pulvis-pyrius CBS 109.77]|uniref:Uncharacterized protein n=1 Tax=Melanomma pulvis-pyrius CBS 109.77 TaxID=1314802 RepID=A0A6A6XTQ7_9PLEO|nr:hypothetical protein K505DRAFT_332089 [Melanomma pulvis-pyrius CBS 109.77]